jgi:hypothetical protein
MTYFADLSPCTYFRIEGPTPRLLAIGWLDSDLPSAPGAVSESVRRRLAALCPEPWCPFLYLGTHPCGLCVRAAGLPPQRHGSPEFPCCNGTVFIPGNGCVYATPMMIEHYIDAHGYRAPDEFCEAVLACPPMWSDEYFAALRANADPGLAAIVPVHEDNPWPERRRQWREAIGLPPGASLRRDS